MNNANLIGLTSDKFNEKPDARVFFKRQALLFDRIAVLNLNSLVDAHSSGNSDSGKSFAADLEWLASEEVIFDPKTPHPQAFYNDPGLLSEKLSRLKLDSDSINLITEASTDSEQLFEAAEVLIAKISERGSLPSGDSETKDQANAFRQAYNTQSASELRYAVQWMRLVNGTNAVLAHSLEDYRFENMPKTRKETVWQILLSKVPVLDENTPWERILDFRKDTESKHKLLALKQWVNGVAATEKSPHDIEDEFAYLKSEYEEALKHHKVEFEFGILEAVVRPALEIPENFLKLKWSKLPDSFLKMRKHEIELQKAEAEAKGREISYLVKVEKQFGNKT